MPRPTLAPLTAGIVAALLLLLGAYMGSYYALLDGPNFWMEGAPPMYHSDNQPIRLVLSQAQRIDRFVRPRYWGEQP